MFRAVIETVIRSAAAKRSATVPYNISSPPPVLSYSPSLPLLLLSYFYSPRHISTIFSISDSYNILSCPDSYI